MKKQNKKGFTLVELLVVIAILAILATVSVVGYSQFTTKAKESNDMTELHQYTTLIEAQLMDGEEVVTIDSKKYTIKYDTVKGVYFESTETFTDDVAFVTKVVLALLNDEKGKIDSSLATTIKTLATGGTITVEYVKLMESNNSVTTKGKITLKYTHNLSAPTESTTWTLGA